MAFCFFCFDFFPFRRNVYLVYLDDGDLFQKGSVGFNLYKTFVPGQVLCVASYS